MALVELYEESRSARAVFFIPDRSFVTFVAKIQKAKTRKAKEYFVLRATVPKDVAEKIDAKPGDYLFFKTKKAEWYHMLNWKEMDKTWQMLPDEIRNQAIMDGLQYPGAANQFVQAPEPYETLSSTNPTAYAQIPQKTESHNTIR
jgi:hypothetical protein